MKVVIQRVKEASVSIKEEKVANIEKGFLLLVGIEDEDKEDILLKMAKKCIELRIFEDENEKMNLSIMDIHGKIISVSQFTLYADCRKGRRPSFSKAGRPEYAKGMYDRFNGILRQYGIEVQTGVFGADMQVNLCNDGPVTILLDSEEI